jgi:hypothetical protein
MGLARITKAIQEDRFHGFGFPTTPLRGSHFSGVGYRLLRAGAVDL